MTSIQRLLTRPRFSWTVTALAIALTLPSLRVGWIADDHFQRVRLTGDSRFAEVVGRGTDLFAFFDGNPARTHRLMDVGAAPWWSNGDIRAAFWRPLAVWTHRVDYALWPGRPWLMHLQSVLWHGMLVGMVAVLYRRFMGTAWLAGLAALLYAVDDAHGMPVAFLANRNAILSTVFGVAAMLAHDGWRRRRSVLLLTVASACLATSLLCAEFGIGACAYLFAYAMVIERGSRWVRVRSLAPYVVVVIAWRTAWDAMGYGVSGVGLYVDPLKEPMKFLGGAIHNGPVLLLGQWAGPPSDVDLLLGTVGRWVLWLFALSVVTTLGVLAVPVLRRDRVARFWALGMVLALAPVCATFPLDRLLFFVGIGAMGLMARLLASALAPDAVGSDKSPRRLFPRWAGAGLAILHLAVAPLALPLRAAYPMGPPQLGWLTAVHTNLDAAVEQQDLIVVNAPNPLLVHYLPVIRELAGLPTPRRTRALAPAIPAIRVSRVDPRTLLIECEESFQPWKFDLLFRPGDCPMHVGDRVDLTGISIEVTEVTPNGAPKSARFRFDVPLDDSSLRWLHWRRGEFTPFVPPPVGETVELRAGLRWSP